MKKVLIVLIFGVMQLDTVYAFQDASSENADTTRITPHEIKKFEQRYNNYLKALDRSNVSSISTYRRYSIKSISDQRNDDILLHPTNDIISYDAPVNLLMSYFVHFEDYQIVEVDVFDVKIYDSGFTIIYDENDGEIAVNYFKLDLDSKALEAVIKEQLLSRDIKLEHEGEKRYDEIKLQVFYHREYKIK